MNIPSTRPFFSEEDILAISSEVCSILRSGRLILGPYTQKFEELFQKYCGVKHAIAVSSCTSALEITLRYFNIKDKEVMEKLKLELKPEKFDLLVKLLEQVEILKYNDFLDKKVNLGCKSLKNDDIFKLRGERQDI